MDKAQALIRLYQTCFYACMAVTILGLVCAVFFFFKFDIRTIIEIRTGRAAKRAIRKMAEANAMTGRLRAEDMDFTTGGLQTGRSGPITGSGQTAPLAVPANETTPLAQAQPVQAPNAGLPPAPAVKPGFAFAVTQSVMLIHTQEQI